MRKIVFAALALITWFGHEWLKEVFWERALHVLSPENSLVLQYGPPIAFAAITAYYLIKSRERSSKEMLAIAAMIVGAVLFVAGLLLYKGETGKFPFSEGETEHKEIGPKDIEKKIDPVMDQKLNKLEELYSESQSLLSRTALLPKEADMQQISVISDDVNKWSVELESLSLLTLVYMIKIGSRTFQRIKTSIGPTLRISRTWQSKERDFFSQ